MSNGLQQVINYMIPAVGTPRAYFWSGVLTGSPVVIDFRSVSGGGIDGQVFRPSGVFIDNTQGLGNVAITVNEISYQMICLPGELLNLQFPAPVDCTVSFVGNGQATIAFVDFPVLPYRNLATGGMANPMTTLGDLIIGGVAGDATRLPIGTEGQELVVTGGVPSWQDPTGVSAFFDITGDAFDNANLGGYLQELFDDKLPRPGADGIVIRNGPSGVQARTLTGTANKISVTNGDGTLGNPTISIPDAVTLVTPTVSTSINLTGGQIAFPAVQVPSANANTLDDYEEGTWTPVLTFATPGDLARTYTTQLGVYTKVGRQVIAEFEIVTATFTHTTAAGNLQITGLPFTKGAGQPASVDSITFGGITAAGYGSVVAKLAASSNVINFEGSGSAQPPAMVTVSNVPTGGSVVLRGKMIYNV